MILELKNISFSFTGTKYLIDNIDLLIKEKTIYALTGTNGSGKTTLFNIISGFLKPKTGKIIFKQKNISSLLPFEINLLGIGRIFQDLRMITKLTVKENIILAMKNNPTDIWYNSLLPKFVFNNKLSNLNRIANKLINDYYLNDVKDNLAGEISFGQQKLLTLACCEANEPDLILLDEPIAGINPEYLKIIGYLLLHLKEKGRTIFFIEHNTEFISNVADKIIFLNQGKISEFSSVCELTNDQNVKEAYL